MQKFEILKTVFGHDKFRSFQEKAVDAILHQKDVLMILPTGGGKSLCYQLPSLMMPGVTVVVSPLIALMHDQVMALKANGIKAEMMSSMQTREQLDLIRYDLLQGELKLLYIAPERFSSPSFLGLLKQVSINFFVIDEAHCVSEWGHEFREDYRKLHLLRENFPNIGIAAFTATATPKVQVDISSALRLNTPVEIRGKIFRENLHISVEPRIKDGKSQLIEFLKNFKNDSGIVYAFSRKQTESLAEFLQKQGVKALPFHAGLPNHIKEETFRKFVHDEIQVVVATIAFGMGIDKSNIRFVVHMSLPKTIENYYQEIGRAGRDGLDSEVLLLSSGSDMMMQREFIDQLEDTPYKQNAFNKLELISRYAGAEACRHQYIASYFEDELEDCQTKCDNCTAQEVEKTDISIEAQKLLSSVYRTGQRFGQSYVIDVLRGSSIEKILSNAHDKLSVYGIGKELSKAYWDVIMERLMEIGALKRGEFRALMIDAMGMKILKKEMHVDIKSQRLNVKAKKEYKSHTQDLDLNVEAFESLRSLRSEIAKEEGKPAYIVFGDKTLKEMANHLPQDKEEMLNINGVGEVKFERYGEQFLSRCLDLKS
ncbi:DNA helicase RecQ [Sulfurimonas sp. MAG313]|nr:DNA helicase RecQ [Sulfurimonas sp. MAG313]MDF1880656.1 DNA helicase RecQ [Sulfurimonas sp. MAG313]